MKENIARSRSSLDQSEGTQLDALGDAFERAWRNGDRPRIDEYLPQVGETLRWQLLRELIAVEADLRHAAGEDVKVDEYLARYPDQPALVREALDLLDLTGNYVPAAAGAAIVGGDPLQPGPAVPITPGASPALSAPPLPMQIGRFVIQQRLGGGAFGVVYLAADPELGRQVALKVPQGDRFTNEEERQAFLRDAQHAARLNHPGIVTVYDVGSQDGQIFIVQEYMPGGDLRQKLKSTSLSCEQAVQLMIPIAEAVSFAHQHDIFHRDLKPANILLDAQDRPRVADFGLSLHANAQKFHRHQWAGSPAYMSPEQVRRESHRLDGRSDIWALGVMLYELLTGRRPFGGNLEELQEQIKYREPRPLREIKPELPDELERICLKCLAKAVTQRYSTAADLARDLRDWQCSPMQRGERETRVSKIVPKGLRSFDEKDADFFLDLLPGPRHRSGLPETIQFWKSRIEETNAEDTFAVGLLYGSSGCGKSSLVKAGLLPRLARHVTPIYVEAAADDTEVRVLKGLRRQFPDIPADVSLPQLLAGLRDGLWRPERQKIVLVLDQFEQWLHAKRGETDPQLLQALRHCDGGRLQALLLIRDDFWGATSRFMRAIEIPLVDGDNQFFVDLFDPLHARQVLVEFGRAYGRLPDNPDQFSPEQQAFLEKAVQGLAEEGKVACVRLSLFADMVKGKPWTLSTWNEFGRVEEVAIQFLDQTFEAASAPAAYRSHAKAAQKVLHALLPEIGTNIKGSRQSEQDLLKASGYGAADFDALRRILDKELRLITPTDPEGGVKEEVRSEKGESDFLQPSSLPLHSSRYYQMTHDYLVPSLREWLTRKQKETRRGRAELRLAERAALWNAKPENQQLPSLWEYLSIVGLTSGKNRTDSQQKMIRQAGRVHVTRIAIALFVVALLSWAGYQANGQFQANSLMKSLLSAKEDAVLEIVGQLAPYRRWARPLLTQQLETDPQDADGKRRQLHVRIALLPDDAAQAEIIKKELLSPTTPYSYVGVLRDALSPPRKTSVNQQLVEQFRQNFRHSTPDTRFRAALALATYDPPTGGGSSNSWRE